MYNDNGNFLTYEESRHKYNFKVNFLRYFQIRASIPSTLKVKSTNRPRTSNSILADWTTFHLLLTNLFYFPNSDVPFYRQNPDIEYK